MGGCFARKPEELKERAFTVQNLQKQVQNCPNPCMVKGSLLQDYLHQYNSDESQVTIYSGNPNVWTENQTYAESEALVKSVYENAECWITDLLDSSYCFQVLAKTTKNLTGTNTSSPAKYTLQTKVKYEVWGDDGDVEGILLFEGNRLTSKFQHTKSEVGEDVGEEVPLPMDTYKASSVVASVSAIKGLTHLAVTSQEEKILETLVSWKIYNESILGGVMPFKGTSLTYKNPSQVSLRFQNESGSLEPFSYCLGPLTTPTFGMTFAILIEKPWLFKQFIESEKVSIVLSSNTTSTASTNPATSLDAVRQLQKPLTIFPMILCLQGMWKLIPVSSLLPYGQSNDYPLLTQSLQQEYWLTVLEKALISCISRPENVSRRLRHIGYTFHELTGAPYKEIFLKKVFGGLSTSTAANALETLLDHILDKGFICSLSINGNYNPVDGGLLNPATLTKGIGYVLIKAITTKTSQKLYCLRNPWKADHKPQELFLTTKMAEMQLNLKSAEFQGCVFATKQEILEHFDVLFCGLVDPRATQYTIKGQCSKLLSQTTGVLQPQPVYFFELSVKSEGNQDFYLQMCQEEVFLNHSREILRNLHTFGFVLLTARTGAATNDGMTDRESLVKKASMANGTFHSPVTGRGEAGVSENSRVLEQWFGCGRDMWRKLTLGSGTYQILVYSASSFDCEGKILDATSLNGKSLLPSINLNLYTISSAKVKLVCVTPAYFSRKIGLSTTSESASSFSLNRFLRSALWFLPESIKVPEQILVANSLVRSQIMLASSPLTKIVYENKSTTQSFRLQISVQDADSNRLSVASSASLDGTDSKSPELLLLPGTCGWVGLVRNTLSADLTLTEHIEEVQTAS